MKSMIRFGVASVSLGLLAVAPALKADSLTNNFMGSANYLAGGIIGDTNWDGVYLNSGDIYGGTGSGASTLVAQEIQSAGLGFLEVQPTVGAWIGNQDDSFFLYKVVKGDFDVSVDVTYPFVNTAYHLPGLLVRAYNPNNSGAPYSTTTTNAVENWMYISRFQEFGINEHGRYATNGVDHNGYFDTAGVNSDTNSDRYLRITRVGDTFTFYDRSSPDQPWNQCGNPLVRPDLDGVAMQVGIHDESGTGNSPITYFYDFQLSGTNVTFPAMPPAPSAFATTATNTSGSLTFTWTKGNPGDSSLVVMSEGRTIRHNPVNGITYNADGAYGNSSALLDGAAESVVYSGTNNTVTVSNLSANIFTYTVAVYEYTNNGTETVYNTAAPTTNSVAGPGVINNVTLSVNTTNIPVNGATSFRVLADFSTGESNVDQTANATWATSAPTIANVDTAGTVSGITNGSATITATLGTFTPTVDVTVHGPYAFSDNYANTHDYIADGLAGSVYDGLFMNYGDVPGGRAGADGAGSTLTLNSQIADTNGLYMSSVQSDWQGTADDGPFLFRIVPGSNQGLSGDFEALVHINSMNTLNGALAGLMARTFNPADAGPGPGGAENHVNYWKAQAGTTTVRATDDGANTTYVGAGPSGTDGWLLIQRSSSTNFYFYEKAATNDLWTRVASVVLPAAADNAPMEVGPAEQSTLGVNVLATYDTFAVDAPGLVSTTPMPPAATNLVMTLNTNDLSMTLNWVAADNSGNPVASIVVMRPEAPVSAQPPVGVPVTGNSVFGQGSNLGGNNYVVFVSDNPPASTNNTVTVSGLAPGVKYYAAVYTYAGTGTDTVFNTTGAIETNLIDGFQIGVTGSLAGGIPLGGIGTPVVQAIFTGGIKVVENSGVTLVSGDTNVVQIAGRVLTGIGMGTAPITNSFGGFSSVLYVTVRQPSFTDEFTTDHDYLVDGVTNTGWDGIYDPGAGYPIPGSTYNPAGDSTSVAAAAPVTNVVITATNITATSTNYTYVTNVFNVLTITSTGNGWENADAGGFFLFKYVAGDFQMAVHIHSFDVQGYNQPGILARAYATTNGVSGYPLGYAVPNAGGTNDTGEYWVSLTRFDEFGIGTYARQNIDSGVTQSTQPDQGDGNFWLLIVRSGDGSQFDFYKRATMTNAWVQVPNRTHYSISQVAGQPMQVGIMAGPWGGPSSVEYNHFMLDASAPVLGATASAGNINVSWPAVGNYSLESTPSLAPPFVNWQAVTSPLPIVTNGFNMFTEPATNGTMFFRLAPPTP